MPTDLLPPGPRLPRVTQAWMWTYRYPRFTTEAHARFGDTFTVRVGGLPTSVLTIDREVIRRLFTGDPLTKRHGNDLLRAFVGDHSVMVLEPPDHLARRKLLLPPFHGERVRGYARLMERLAAAELDLWHADDVVEVLPIAQQLTLDVILQAVLGISDAQVRERLREIFDAMINPVSSYATYFPQMARRAWFNPLALRYWQLKDQLDGLLAEHIAATRADPGLEGRDDILAMMVLARDGAGEGLTDTELRDEIITLITAGHETTATAIAWGAELLAHNPDVRARALDASRTGDDAYLDAMVKEILRIRSPVPIAGARHATEPMAIGEWTIPPEVTVIVNSYGLHHDASIYPEPEAFRPERFIDAAPDAYAYAFLPFGGGAHRCLGAALAQLEIKVVLHAMLERFDLAATEQTLTAGMRRGVTLAPRNRARVRVTARREAAVAAA